MKNDYLLHKYCGDDFYKTARAAEEKGNTKLARVSYIKAALEYNRAEKYCKDDAVVKSLRVKKEICNMKQNSFGAQKKEMVVNGEEGITDSFEIPIPSITYDNVAGMEREKSTLEDALILPSINHKKFREYVPHSNTATGVLLYGPPGCGKTHLAYAIAGEAAKAIGSKVTYLYATQNKIMNPLVGIPQKNLYNLFKEAKEKAPSIIFIDEFDAIAPSRSKDLQGYESKITNQLLTCFEIFDPDDIVLVLAATNKPWNIDDAVVRTGRFSKLVPLNPPDEPVREELFKMYLKGNKHLADNIDYKKLASLTKYFASSDIEYVCRDVGLDVCKKSIKLKKDYEIKNEDLINKINNTVSSLYRWVARYRDEKKHSGELIEEFSELEALADEIETYKKTQMSKTRKPFDKSPQPRKIA